MEGFQEVLNRPLLEIGDWTFTLAMVVKALVILFLSLLLSRVIARGFLRRVLKKAGIDVGVANAIVTITYYLLPLIGLSFLMGEMGINTANLAVFAGAIGLGVGFGLQDIAKNFIAGLVLLVTRPIKPGDRIVTDGLEADVKKIGAYFTSVQTLDDASVIIPNHDLLNSRLLNWTYENEKRRFRVPIGVHYNSDPILVRDVLLKVAGENSDVVPEPPPVVLLKEYADSSINFELVVWTATMTYRPFQMISDLNFAIHKALKEAGIEIPYPQRDLHIRSTSVPLGN